MRRGSIRVIRRGAFKAVPWKNGGGVTHEAVRVPASGDPFEWRVSVACIDASGPFSEFADHDRKMVLLEGRGLVLRFGDGTSTTLSAVGDLAEFDGAMPTHGELIDGSCMDLNLMVLKGTAASAQVLRATRHDIDAFGGVALVFPIDRGVTLVTAEGESASIAPGDLAVLCEGAGQVETPAGGVASMFVAVLGP
jgi:environmental stress-induced protein Ves